MYFFWGKILSSLSEYYPVAEMFFLVDTFTQYFTCTPRQLFADEVRPRYIMFDGFVISHGSSSGSTCCRLFFSQHRCKDLGSDSAREIPVGCV